MDEPNGPLETLCTKKKINIMIIVLQVTIEGVLYSFKSKPVYNYE